MRIVGTGEETMHEQARQAYRKRSIVLALVALALWALRVHNVLGRLPPESRRRAVPR